MATRRRKATADEVKALAHPLRLRIIRALYDGPQSNKELAMALHEDPATVLYHVRTLAKTGFVKPAGTRPGPRGSVEKLYRSTGKSWRLDVDTGLPAAGQANRANLDAFLAELRDAGPDALLETARLALVLSPDRRTEFNNRLGELLDEYAFDEDEAGERIAVFYATHRRA
jgi:DNA-binding transcriptional ArsR family regulator